MHCNSHGILGSDYCFVVSYVRQGSAKRRSRPKFE